MFFTLFNYFYSNAGKCIFFTLFPYFLKQWSMLTALSNSQYLNNFLDIHSVDDVNLQQQVGFTSSPFTIS